ncbi:hypothetical protein [Methanomethylophilus alvi]|mgnify:CR=1 FL=1|uniref:hypothetical protein n=1 Tax=Methanomethylophilus alvi TaxID=1291540 RepID=UPI0037DD19AB
MKRFFSGLVVAVLILTFIVAVYCHGEDRRFSVEYYLDNLSQLKTSFFLTNVTLVWMSDEYVIPDFSTGGVSTYTLNRYTGDNETFQFFDSLRCFFMRCTHTGAWLARTASDLLSNFAYLLPWNAVVHADGTRVPMNASSSSGRF